MKLTRKSTGSKTKKKSMNIIKRKARTLINNLSEKATWEDLMYQVYVNKKIDNSILALQEEKVLLHDEVKKRVLGK